ncbi:urea transporter 2 [Eurytemora carolleeae]|uniref:urea transporter 2 n=1 Tax=Eurytemora carolleeae TaxID=1294199 RepID=UPI000C7869E7|nr:urea transporter 2 [Eurytemora carolleeae]XP_023325638.1 urea transporter 2 [Eurytemora carolleeae]XP_023325639.1 urea transporter 2 [Eurytemora carolleeae]XP_023325641.1 urea transporter 2 [Eurytemora carolleeae]|eukprot:XP_023325637.1 urea transporter 2-like [Eurytemora affinis]
MASKSKENAAEELKPTEEKGCGQRFMSIFGECELSKNLIRRNKNSIYWIPFRFVDAILRGISQVVFVSNPISGALILSGIYLGGIVIGHGTLACTVGALLSALYFKQPSDAIQDGLTQFNGVLVGSVTFSLYPAIFGGVLDLRSWSITVLGSVISVPIQVALVGLLQGVKASFKNLLEKEERKEYGVPGFTLPFNLTACMVMSLLLATHQDSLDTSSQNPNKNSTAEIVPSSEDSLLASDVIVGVVKSMGQVYAVNTLPGSLLMLLGVFIYSPLLAFIELSGACLGTLLGLYLNPGYPGDVYAGIWGYCALLTAGATGGFFAILTPRAVPLVILAISTTAALQKTIQPFLQIGGLPVFTFPFVLTSWVFLLVTTDNGVLYRTDNPTVPERNIKIWMDTVTESRKLKIPDFIQKIRSNKIEDAA